MIWTQREQQAHYETSTHAAELVLGWGRLIPDRKRRHGSIVLLACCVHASVSRELLRRHVCAMASTHDHHFVSVRRKRKSYSTYILHLRKIIFHFIGNEVSFYVIIGKQLCVTPPLVCLSEQIFFSMWGKWTWPKCLFQMDNVDCGVRFLIALLTGYRTCRCWVGLSPGPRWLTASRMTYAYGSIIEEALLLLLPSFLHCQLVSHFLFSHVSVGCALFIFWLVCHYSFLNH